MYFNKIFVVLSFAASALTMPIGDASSNVHAVERRALTFRTYAQFQVSDGKAGNALAEVQAKFPIDTANLASVSKSDLDIINAARETAEAAETDAFNTAVSSASTAADKQALQNGKIKNKVLKLFLETTALKVQQAQGDDNQAKIDQEQKKLDTNIALDKKAAGQASKSVAFTGDVQP